MVVAFVGERTTNVETLLARSAVIGTESPTKDSSAVIGTESPTKDRRVRFAIDMPTAEPTGHIVLTPWQKPALICCINSFVRSFSSQISFGMGNVYQRRQG
jgi:hypothetical protein